MTASDYLHSAGSSPPRYYSDGISRNARRGNDYLGSPSPSPPRYSSSNTSIKTKRSNGSLQSLSRSSSPTSGPSTARTSAPLSSANTSPDLPIATMVPLPNSIPMIPPSGTRINGFMPPHNGGNHFSSEAHALVIKYLDATTSTCLGLTCIEFYIEHFRTHGPVSLYSSITILRRVTLKVHQLIRVWMAPLVFNVFLGIFIEWEYHLLLTQNELHNNYEKNLNDDQYLSAVVRQGKRARCDEIEAEKELENEEKAEEEQRQELQDELAREKTKRQMEEIAEQSRKRQKTGNGRAVVPATSAAIQYAKDVVKRGCNPSQ